MAITANVIVWLLYCYTYIAVIICFIIMIIIIIIAISISIVVVIFILTLVLIVFFLWYMVCVYCAEWGTTKGTTRLTAHIFVKLLHLLQWLWKNSYLFVSEIAITLNSSFSFLLCLFFTFFFLSSVKVASNDETSPNASDSNGFWFSLL